MTCGRLTKLVKPVMLMLFALAFSLSASRATSANSKTTAPGEAATIERNAKEVKRSLPHIIDRTRKINPKLAKALSACNCAAPAAGAGFGTCLKNCLINAGVNPYSAAGCAALCSRNPLGCAICAGVGEWILAYCVQYCAWYPVFNGYEARQLRPSKPRGTQQVRLVGKVNNRHGIAA